MHKLLLKECFNIRNRAFLINIIKKFTQSLDTFGFIHYLYTDIGQGRTLMGGQAKLGSITFNGGAFVILKESR